MGRSGAIESSQWRGIDRANSVNMTAIEKTRWQYLEQRPHPWREQLYLKGKKLRAFTVWMAMLANDMTPEETALDWDIPLEVVREAIEYCESHRDLLGREAKEERRRLEEGGYSLEPKITRRFHSDASRIGSRD